MNLDEAKAVKLLPTFEGYNNWLVDSEWIKQELTGGAVDAAHADEEP
ncbi:hypothetical protein ACKF11_03665 [Methylobacillus sp. Pita2]